MFRYRPNKQTTMNNYATKRQNKEKIVNAVKSDLQSKYFKQKTLKDDKTTKKESENIMKLLKANIKSTKVVKNSKVINLVKTDLQNRFNNQSYSLMKSQKNVI